MAASSPARSPPNWKSSQNVRRLGSTLWISNWNPPRASKKSDLQKLRDTGIGLLISHHDFTGTRDLDSIFNRIEAFHPDFIKVVPTARALVDNLTLIRFLERMNDHSNIIGICMGDAGIISRVLGVRAGSAFTFAAATLGEETGPGQIAARTLIETYRIDQVDAATKVYGVAGNPIRSSLSPIMMNTAFRRETVNAVYLALQTTRLSDLLKLVHEIPIQGISVTMPLKQEILSHLERTDPLSARIGACNTVLRAQDGKLYGFNTDVAGITGPLEKRMPLAGARILVLGAGGAARAAVFGLREKGAAVFILNRTAETAQKLARQSGSKTIRLEALAKTSFDAIVNATPVGMAGNKAAPLAGGQGPQHQAGLRPGLQPAGDAADPPCPPVVDPLSSPALRCSSTRARGSSRYGQASPPPRKRCSASCFTPCAGRLKPMPPKPPSRSRRQSQSRLPSRLRNR